MIDEAKRAELKEKHPDGEFLRSEDGTVEVFVRPPTRPDYKRFRSMAFVEAKRPDALESLVRACVVHPDAQGFDAVLEKRPGLAESFGEALLKMAGVGAAQRG